MSWEWIEHLPYRFPLAPFGTPLSLPCFEFPTKDRMLVTDSSLNWNHEASLVPGPRLVNGNREPLRKHSLSIIHLCLIMTVVGAAPFVKKDPTQFVDAIVSSGPGIVGGMGACAHLSTEKLVHIENGRETNRMLLLPALHGL